MANRYVWGNWGAEVITVSDNDKITLGTALLDNHHGMRFLLKKYLEQNPDANFETLHRFNINYTFDFDLKIRLEIDNISVDRWYSNEEYSK
jgi:DUF2075 family protein